MGMFSKVIAFLDKAAGVPAWITHADNIRKLKAAGCHTLVKAIVENPSFHHMAAYSVEQIVEQLAGDYKGVDYSKLTPEFREFASAIVYEVVAAYEGPTTGPIEVLQNFLAGVPTAADIEVVEVDAPSSLINFAEEVFAKPLKEEGSVESPTPDLDNLDTDAIPLDEAAKAQLLQGMLAVISRGRKPAPTLNVLRNMSMGDRSLIVEALSRMEAKGNTLAKAILEDPSL